MIPYNKREPTALVGTNHALVEFPHVSSQVYNLWARCPCPRHSQPSRHSALTPQWPAALTCWRMQPHPLGEPPQPSSLGTAIKPSLHLQGPFNPAASIPSKVVKKILDLEFIEMAEVTVDSEPTQVPGRPPPPARLPITDISQWTERYSLMAATLAARFPEKASELFAYQATIIRAERNYDAGRWVTYDRQFRREALARKDLNWSVTDPRLYNEAFTGRARSIPRCTYCLQDDHTGQYCPKNPNGPWSGWFPDPSTWQSAAGMQTPLPPPAAPPPRQSLSAEICRRFNEGRCRQQRCRYAHTCRDCGAPHPSVACPSNQTRPANRARSPFRLPNPAPQTPSQWQAKRF